MNGCLLPAFFAAAHGVGPPVLTPDLPSASVPTVSPSKTLKALPSEAADNEIGSANFTVQWDALGVEPEFAETVSQHLEDAWGALIERDAWDAPMTSDTHKVLVWLTPDLAAPGLATGEPTEAFPAGQPIIYLNPDLLTDAAYLQQVVHHEFVHTTQFHLRDWYGGADSEAWYWEASAEWLTEYVDPAANGQAWLSVFYADDPGAAFDTVNGGHEYAMFLLNAYLDEHQGGLEGLQSVWLENEGSDWLAELERVYGLPAQVLWSDFTGAYYAGQLRDAELYTMPDPVSSAGTIPGDLGSMYIELDATEGRVVLDGGEGALVRDGAWLQFSGEATIPDGEGGVVLVVTNPDASPLDVMFEVRAEPSTVDTGSGLDDTGAAEDTGTPEADGPPVNDAPSGDGAKGPSSGCTVSPTTPALWAWPLLLVGLRRRCVSRRGCPPR